MPNQEHKQLKAMAAFYGVSLRVLVLSCVREHLLSNNEPNAETLKAFKETEEGKGLVHCENFDDFMAKLGIK
jgi:antitoxin component of RelBE/YafQ-DinJ toxin-antitoxin module